MDESRILRRLGVGSRVLEGGLSSPGKREILC
jgi:hypothetical protein